MDEIEIKITFVDNLCGCEITKSGKTEQWETLERKEQIHVCSALAKFYNLFVPAIKEDNDE